MTKLAIYLPVHNEKELALEAIQSIIDQTNDNYNVYILDNSDDNETSEIVKNYLKQKESFKLYYRFYKQDDNTIQEPWRILNERMSKTKENYFMYLAADDVLEPNAVEEILNFGPDTVMYFAINCYDYDNGVERFASSMHTGTEVGLNTSINPNCIIDGGAVVVNTKWYKSLDPMPKYPIIKENLKGNYDGDFLEELAKHTTFKNLNKTLVRKRKTKFSHWSPL